mmetsp:Transcript_30311/g.94091  ORF Transcript_30311/g.94091 Transcript_30311/m.94091 type:complete len:277 (-) Transcript_30311:19-849(-)
MAMMMFGILAYSVIRARPLATSIVARFPRLAFFAGLVLLNSVSAVLVNMLSELKDRQANPAMVVCIAVFFIRGSGFAVRYIFRSINVPLVACFALLFTYETGFVLSLRRYWFDQPTLQDVVLAAMTSSGLELICNCFSSAYAVLTYNDFMRRGLPEMASAHANVFFTSVLSELIAEHVALHSLVGYHIFLDPRVLSLSVQTDKTKVFKAWLVSFFAELATDFITMVPMLGFLPIGLSISRRGLPFLPMVMFLLCAPAHAHLLGLHSYLDQRRYFCD